MDVGVRELNQNLSAYLDRAARGETIRVTDRGLPKAILAPVPGAARKLKSLVQLGRCDLELEALNLQSSEAAACVHEPTIGGNA